MLTLRGKRHSAHAQRHSAQGVQHFGKAKQHFPEQTSHTASFYWALLAAIYTLQADDDVLMYFAMTSFALNFVAFLARFSMDYATIDYREEQY